MNRRISSGLALLGFLFFSIGGCAMQPPQSNDALVTEALQYCGRHHLATLPPPAANTAAPIVHEENLEREYQRVLGLLHTPGGYEAAAQRARTAVDPMTQFCSLEIAVRLDPDRARVLYEKELKANPTLALDILRDAYLREALKPLGVKPRRTGE